jgi:hypothetical protein
VLDARETSPLRGIDLPNSAAYREFPTQASGEAPPFRPCKDKTLLVFCAKDEARCQKSESHTASPPILGITAVFGTGSGNSCRERACRRGDTRAFRAGRILPGRRTEQCPRIVRAGTCTNVSYRYAEDFSGRQRTSGRTGERADSAGAHAYRFAPRSATSSSGTSRSSIMPNPEASLLRDRWSPPDGRRP